MTSTYICARRKGHGVRSLCRQGRARALEMGTAVRCRNVSSFTMNLMGRSRARKSKLRRSTSRIVWRCSLKSRQYGPGRRTCDLPGRPTRRPGWASMPPNIVEIVLQKTQESAQGDAAAPAVQTAPPDHQEWLFPIRKVSARCDDNPVVESRARRRESGGAGLRRHRGARFRARRRRRISVRVTSRRRSQVRRVQA